MEVTTMVFRSVPPNAIFDGWDAGFAGLPKADLLDYLKDPKPLTTADGVFAINDAPGLGIVLDTEGDRCEAAGPRCRLDPSRRHLCGMVMRL
jgi:L-alanine-DL-glutamate epimerase-like enolase superfamily enzyme